MNSRDPGPASSLGSDWVGGSASWTSTSSFFFVSGSETAASAFLATLLEQDETFRLACLLWEATCTANRLTRKRDGT